MENTERFVCPVCGNQAEEKHAMWVGDTVVSVCLDCYNKNDDLKVKCDGCHKETRARFIQWYEDKMLCAECYRNAQNTAPKHYLTAYVISGITAILGLILTLIGNSKRNCDEYAFASFWEDKDYTMPIDIMFFGGIGILAIGALIFIYFLCKSTLYHPGLNTTPQTNSPQKTVCPNCRKEFTAEGAKVCPFCLTEIGKPKKIICPSCHSETDASGNFCSQCGYNFPKAEPEPQPGPESKTEPPASVSPVPDNTTTDTSGEPLTQLYIPDGHAHGTVGVNDTLTGEENKTENTDTATETSQPDSAAIIQDNTEKGGKPESPAVAQDDTSKSNNPEPVAPASPMPDVCPICHRHLLKSWKNCPYCDDNTTGETDL